MKKFDTGLFISDVHAPYHHPDIFKFLIAVKRRYRPDWVGFSGDERDHHADSYHESHPDIYSSGMEHDCALAAIKQLHQIFPRADVLKSNHGSLPERKLISSRMTAKLLKSESERSGAPGWTWHEQLRMKSGEQEILFIHGHRRSANDVLLAQKLGVCLVQGHHHSKFSVQWWNTGSAMKFAATVGCLIDDRSLAFSYNKMDSSRPLLGVLLIKDGVPRLLPMFLNKDGKWTKQVP